MREAAQSWAKFAFDHMASELRGLNAMQAGFYLRIWAWCVQHRCGLPVDEVAFEMDPRNAEEEAALKLVLEKRFWVAGDECWINDTCIDCINQCNSHDELCKKRREIGARGGKVSANARANGQPIGQPNGQANAGEYKNLRTKEEKENKEKASRSAPALKPEDVSDECWQGWCKHRARKHASVTDRVVNGLRDEGAKAGMTLEQVMDAQVMNGWQGFNADWVAKKPQQVKALTYSEREQEEFVNRFTGGF